MNRIDCTNCGVVSPLTYIENYGLLCADCAYYTSHIINKMKEDYIKHVLMSRSQLIIHGTLINKMTLEARQLILIEILYIKVPLDITKNIMIYLFG